MSIEKNGAVSDTKLLTLQTLPVQPSWLVIAHFSLQSRAAEVAGKALDDRSLSRAHRSECVIYTGSIIRGSRRSRPDTIRRTYSGRARIFGPRCAANNGSAPTSSVVDEPKNPDFAENATWTHNGNVGLVP
jgi:hypothetical protein